MVTFTATTTHQLPQSAAFDMTNGQRDRQTDSREERDNFEPYGDSRRARASEASAPWAHQACVRSMVRLVSNWARSASKPLREWGRAREIVLICCLQCWEGALNTRPKTVNCTQKWFFDVGLSAIYMPYLTASESINTRLLTENEWCCKPTFTRHMIHK